MIRPAVLERLCNARPLPAHACNRAPVGPRGKSCAAGIYVRGSGKYQLNIWCWPIGSGEMYGIRTDSKMPAEVRAAVTPRTQADKPVGEWNHFEITVRGDTVTVLLNGKTVIPGAQIPNLPARGRIALQHHGGSRDGKWNSPPALLQFRNIFIKELDK